MGCSGASQPARGRALHASASRRLFSPDALSLTRSPSASRGPKHLVRADPAETAQGLVRERSTKILCPHPLSLSLHGRVWLRDAAAGVPATRSAGVRAGWWAPGGADRSSSWCYDQTHDSSRRGHVARIGESGELCKCSFCGQGQSQVRKLIAGPGVWICDGCVDTCCEILDIEGLPLPRRYNASFELETVLSRWVDGINNRDGVHSDIAREFLEGLLARLRR
jgi:hypothetical protein